MISLITAAVTRHKKALASAVGLALLGWMQTGEGATQRTGEEKLREVQVTPQDFMTDEQKMNVFLRLATVDVWDAIMAAFNSLPDPTAGYYGGGTVGFPQGRYGISQPAYYPKSGITAQGVGSLSAMLVPLDGFVGNELLRIDPADHASYVIYRNCSVRDLGFDHDNVSGLRSITAYSLNDNCEFKNLRSINFDGTVFLLGKSARVGALLAQGVKIDSWDAIATVDLIDDVFVVDEANEILFLNNKALGLSSGVSDKAGFHIGRNGLAQGVTMISNSAAHIPGGVGIRFNWTANGWAYHNTIENCVYDILVGHDTDASKCSFVDASANRHYPTPGMPAYQTDVYINRATSCVARVRENGALNITVNAVNCEAYIATNRTDGTTLPPTVTLASPSSVVHETHKNGTAIHHANGSMSFTSSAGVFEVKLPGGGSVRGDASKVSLIAAAGKGARLLANSGSVEVTSTGGVTVSGAAGQQVALQESGANKILLDGSGRVRVFGLTTDVPGVADSLYKDASGFVMIT